MKLPLLLLGALLAAPLAAGEPYQIAVIPKGTTHEFWKSIHAGAVKAGRELNAAAGREVVHIIWQGPLREDDREQQVQVVENFIGRQVDGLVLAPLDRKALVEPVETAVRSHIRVVTIDSALDSPAPSSFIATDNQEGGRLAARHLGRLLGGKGNVILLRFAVGSASTEAREAGFLEVMQRDFPDIKLISADQYAGGTRDTARRVADNLLNRYGRTVDGIFAVNESSAAGMLLALRDAGLAGGRVKLVGFDTGEVLLDGLRKGDLQGIVVQNPFKMGYLGVKTIMMALRGEAVPIQIDTGVDFVTKENMTDPAIAELLAPPLDQYLK